ncbi:dehydrogenase/reductase SDR family member 7-like isoform X2 [Porites lutea]|uniref:dehydrogenase/reductase SDR family member 7-like isoform X2 n=1 Tax=Porites lutea TaxID=51062 RepID=UPI003CC59C1A
MLGILLLAFLLFLLLYLEIIYSLPLFLLIFIARIYFSDCDTVLHFYATFAKKPEPRLRGKVVWITGASSGIGEHLAYRLAQCGCKLVLSARRRDELERVKNQCLDVASKIFPLTFEEDFLVLPLDVTDFPTHEGCPETVIKHFGKIDFLVNNAGLAQMGSSVASSLDVDQAVMKVNVLGAISLTKAVLPHMVHNKSGQIVVVSSASGKCAAGPNTAAYGASKHALQTGKDRPFPPTTIKTERCVNLITIAMVNGLNEVWIAIPKRMFELYLAQYSPFLFNWWLRKKTNKSK